MDLRGGEMPPLKPPKKNPATHRRSNMTKLASGYAIGCVESNELSSKEFALVKKTNCNATKDINTFKKIYYENINFITQKTIMVVMAKEIPHTAHTG